MKFILFISTAIAALFFISSCKKDNSVSNPSSASLPKSFTEDVTSSGLGHVVETVNLAYDGNGRLLSMTSPSLPGNKILYQYNTNQTFIIDVYSANQISIHSLYWINPNGFADSCFQYNDTQDSSTTKYIYNGAKQLIQQKEYSFSTVSGSVLNNTDTYTYDNNGNVIQDQGDFETTTFDYYPDLLNPWSLGGTYFPQTKNLQKTQTINSGGTPQTITHNYTFDSSNRLKVDSSVASDGGIDVKTYTY